MKIDRATNSNIFTLTTYRLNYHDLCKTYLGSRWHIYASVIMHTYILILFKFGESWCLGFNFYAFHNIRQKVLFNLSSLWVNDISSSQKEPSDV